MTLPPRTAEEVRVMLCDDSATARAVLARLLEAEPGIRVVHRAGDGQAALAALPAARPDVVLLDLEMPVMDGMTALPLILKREPRPIVIVASALTQKGAAATMAAMRAGASDYVPKPAAAKVAPKKAAPAKKAAKKKPARKSASKKPAPKQPGQAKPNQPAAKRPRAE